MAIQQKLKDEILKDGRITAAEAKSLLEAAEKKGLDAGDREDLRTFFVRHEGEMDPDARAFVDEALGLEARRLCAQVSADRKVTEDEATFLVGEIKRNGISVAEREEIHRLITRDSSAIDAKARKILEEALGIGVEAVPRAPRARNKAELAAVRAALELVDANDGKPVLQEVDLPGRPANPLFRDKVAGPLKKFLAEGASSLTQKEALRLAQGIAGGAFKGGRDEPFLAGDRLTITVHYPDGTTQATSGIVVSAGASPLVLFVNRNGYLQLVRQDLKSREQLKIEKIAAGRA